MIVIIALIVLRLLHTLGEVVNSAFEDGVERNDQESLFGHSDSKVELRLEYITIHRKFRLEYTSETRSKRS
jgi:hypothetical protein